MPYIFMYLYILLGFFYNELKKTSKNQNRLLSRVFSFEVTFIALFLFAALRGNGNADYFNYINGVSEIDSLEKLIRPTNYPFEFGFRLLSYISNSIKANPQFVIAAMNLISFSMVYYFIKKRSSNYLLSLIIFFPIVLLFDMHHSRSAIAISSTLLFFDAIYEKKGLKAIFFFLLGFSFHKSAIIMLLLVTVPYIEKRLQMKDSTKVVRLALAFIILLYILVAFINPLSLSLNMLNNKVTYYYFKKLTSYLANDRWSYKFSLLDPRLLLMILIFVLSSSQYKSSKKFEKNLIIIQFFSILSILIFRHSTILVIRIYNFFNIFTIALIPNTLLTFNESSFLEYAGSKKQLNKTYENKKKTVKSINPYQFFIIFAYVIYTLALISKQVNYLFFF